MKHRRQAESDNSGERKKEAPAPPAPHGLHHDESIDTEHEPFSVISQRCRGEYP